MPSKSRQLRPIEGWYLWETRLPVSQDFVKQERAATVSDQLVAPGEEAGTSRMRQEAQRCPGLGEERGELLRFDCLLCTGSAL